jgi:signal transduction histidine kinase
MVAMPEVLTHSRSRTGAYGSAARVPRHTHSSGSLIRAAALVTAYVAAYVVLDFVSYVHPVAPFAITPWNPPPGLSLALLLAFGVRYAPALLVASILAEVLVRGGGAPLHEMAMYGAILTIGYTATAAVLLRTLKLDPRFTSVRDLFVFTATVAASALVISALYVGAHVMAGRFGWSDFTDNALQFWVGDVIGILVTTPFLLVHGRRLAEGRLRIGFEALLQACAIVVVLAIVFSMPDVEAAKFFYLLFLPLIWISVRHGFEGATAGLLVTQVGLIVSVQVAGYTTQSVLEFQMLMLSLAVMGAFLGMAISQWRVTSQALVLREAELNRTLRVAAAAEMASALAHELNQPLTAASNYVQACDIMLGQSGTQTNASLSTTIAKAHAELQRATEVVRRLREFYRGGEARRERVPITQLVASSMQPLSSRLERHQIKVVERLAADLPPALVDRVQIEMVLHNLIANAIDAVSGAASDAREIAIEGAWNGSVLTVAVHDTGPGVSPQIAAELFQTFTTSKAAGMGLGLAISRSIVESHGGRLWLEPSATGARFMLTLPAAK